MGCEKNSTTSPTDPIPKISIDPLNKSWYYVNSDTILISGKNICTNECQLFIGKNEHLEVYKSFDTLSFILPPNYLPDSLWLKTNDTTLYVGMPIGRYWEYSNSIIGHFNRDNWPENIDTPGTCFENQNEVYCNSCTIECLGLYKLNYESGEVWELIPGSTNMDKLGWQYYFLNEAIIFHSYDGILLLEDGDVKKLPYITYEYFGKIDSANLSPIIQDNELFTYTITSTSIDYWKYSSDSNNWIHKSEITSTDHDKFEQIQQCGNLKFQIGRGNYEHSVNIINENSVSKLGNIKAFVSGYFDTYFDTICFEDKLYITTGEYLYSISNEKIKVEIDYSTLINDFDPSTIVTFPVTGLFKKDNRLYGIGKWWFKFDNNETWNVIDETLFKGEYYKELNYEDFFGKRTPLFIDSNNVLWSTDLHKLPLSRFDF